MTSSLVDVPAPSSSAVFGPSAAVTLTDGLLFCCDTDMSSVHYIRVFVHGCIRTCALMQLCSRDIACIQIDIYNLLTNLPADSERLPFLFCYFQQHV